MKYVLIIVLIGCCTYVGFGISKYYSNRKDFFSDFVLLLDKLRLDISFSKEKIGDIIASYTPVNKSFKTLNNNFLQNNQINLLLYLNFLLLSLNLGH